MTVDLALCDIEEGNEEYVELHGLISMYDDMLNACMQGPLDPEDQKELDELYASLLFLEEEMWSGTSYRIVEMINDRLNIDFPLLRQSIDILLFNKNI